ncbi:MAG: hypothetical protein CL607_10980 [Anaerolineaceae bacterium]|nr:hypothetical protein [Anaerolineaceae bacterium]
MKLKCPACGAPISVDSINVQTMTAVCPECDNVFTFDPAKLQPDRKVKPPKQITFYDDAPMHFSFKWDWRTEPMAAIFSIAASFLVAAFVLIPVGMGVLSVLIAMPVIYAMLALTLNSTHFHIADGYLHVYTKPLWYAYYGRHKIPLSDITHISTEKLLDTPSVSRSDTFYNVYAHTVDGRSMIARLVNAQHARFIAQEIESALALPEHDMQGDAFSQRLVDAVISEVDLDEPQSATLSARH